MTNFNMSRFLYNKSMYLSGNRHAQLGPSYKPHKDESELIMKNQDKLLADLEETDPILGEPYPLSSRRGGKYKVVPDTASFGDEGIIDQEAT